MRHTNAVRYLDTNFGASQHLALHSGKPGNIITSISTASQHTAELDPKRQAPLRRGTQSSSNMPPPPSRTSTTGRASVRQGSRAPSIRAPSRATGPSRSGFRSSAASPAASVSSATAGLKRKEHDFDADFSEETNINVVVRCRGRSDREVRENSAVVIKTDGVMGKHIDVSMGPNALSNKTYAFDRVFSQAADQSMIFDDVVKPILAEVSG